MKSCGLIRTNVALTTNVKLVVRSNYGLYLDSIVSSPELSSNRYKKFQFDKDTYWDDIVPTFFQGTPVDLAFKIKYDDDVDKMSTDFANQYDDLYQYGARNIIENKFYSEEYEYFAPLYINKNSLPKNFIIFRVDGPGILRLNKDNFRDEILKKLKFVKNYDLTLKSYLGQWINNSITKNKFYPNNSLYVDFRRFEFSSWKGIDYERGGYTEKTFLLDSTFEFEQLYSDMEKLILEGYKNNKIIFPNIINFSFLFDDTPATKDNLRKWSLNRYLGFYFDDLTLEFKVSPNKLPVLKTDVIIDAQNLLYSPTSDTPFQNEWEVSDYPYIEIDGIYYKLEKFEQITSSTIQKVRNTNNTYEEKRTNKRVIKYKVISEISLNGKKYNDINKNLITIDSDNFLKYQNGNDFTIPNFDSADVWLIEMGDLYHNLIIEGGKVKLYTDYGFNQSSDKFTYYINGINSQFSKSLDLVTRKDYGPIEFKIYRCKFTDIKDFDTDVVETTYSKFEYIKDNELTETDEPKMYVQDLNSTNRPRDYVQFKLQNRVVNIPTSSEYTANSETFRLVENDLTPLWRKNTERLKWGYDGSISFGDYPYLLNNSVLSEDYNKSPNPRDSSLQRDKRNLDHFYTINSDSNSYSHHSLHVENHINGKLDQGFKFEIDKYLGINYNLDYFSYFFGKKTFFDGGKVSKKTGKYSFFQSGDSTTPNITLFKGLRFKLSELENINLVGDKIQKINLKNSNKFEDWKFSILVSNNDFIITSSPTDVNVPSVLKSENALKWRLIDEWKHEKDYATNSVIIYEDILFQNVVSSRIVDPTVNPLTSQDWQYYRKSNIFYSPLSNGIINNNMDGFNMKLPPLVYHSKDYYYSDGLNSYDFWRSSLTYSQGDIVTYSDKNWISLVNDNRTLPSENSGFFTSSVFVNTWEETKLTTRWEKVELWRSDFEYTDSTWTEVLYTFGNYVVYNDIVYGTTQSPSFGVPPNLDQNWKRIYSLVPDTNFFYGPSISNNNIIEMNGKFYECVDNEYRQPLTTNTLINYSLDNGIYIIINEKFKNVLVNIYVNDNTYSEVVETSTNVWDVSKNNLSNTNRDDIYTTIFSKLSTNNIMNSINDLSNKFGFSDNVKYVIVGENSNKIYDFNDLKTVSGLPYLLTCDPPDELLIRNRSNIYQSNTLKSSEIKARRILNDSNIDNLTKLNYYNEMHLSSTITKNQQNVIILPNYSGLKNDIYYRIYRFSGYYSPILKTVELFSSPTLTQSETNYKFDTNLTDFGILKQRIVSKTNRKENLLRLRNESNLKSIYPMIDEFGYHVVDFFMFKSTWDLDYHYETQEYEPEVQLSQLSTKRDDITSSTFRNNNTKLL